MGLDPLVHEGLREQRLVRLVMPVTPVTEHIDNNRLLKLLAELGRDLRDIDDRFGLVSVNVKDRSLDHARHIRAIRRGPQMARIGGEADLIVDDEVDGSASTVTLEAGEAETLRNDALTSKRRVAVDQHRHDRRALSCRAS